VRQCSTNTSLISTPKYLARCHPAAFPEDSLLRLRTYATRIHVHTKERMQPRMHRETRDVESVPHKYARAQTHDGILDYRFTLAELMNFSFILFKSVLLQIVKETIQFSITSKQYIFQFKIL